MPRTINASPAPPQDKTI
ncbi:hypothetical protein E2C01_080775 [Portunus trituberculatus]|uniref:Uncharacterized protein n=1 Tax=Portunus trituberculatus TaxID=210409 RepID=A0A5B7IZ88_PORTR|nr:hypothetical protein [Portunus trituberculatus]